MGGPAQGIGEEGDAAEAMREARLMREGPPPSQAPTDGWGAVPGNTLEEKLAYLKMLSETMARIDPELAQSYAAEYDSIAARAPKMLPAAQPPAAAPEPAVAPAEPVKVPGYKLAREEADKFIVKDGEGEFAVAKAGLKPDMVKHIKGMASGGYVEQPDAGYQQSFFADPQYAPQMPAPIPQHNPWTDIVPGSPADQFMQAMARDSVPGSPAAGLLERAGYSQAPDQPLPEPAEQPEMQAAQQMPQQARGMPGEVTPQEQRAAQSQQPQAQARSAPGGVSRPGAGQQIDAGMAEQRAGINAQADVERQLAAQQTAAWDQYTAERAAQQAQSQQALAEHQAKGAKLYQDVLTSHIDPSRFWANANIGQKVGAGIAMLFGAFGAMANNGKNLVVEQLEREVDKDIDAQKANLGKKQSLLQQHLQAGRDMLSAQHLAKADLYDGLRGQLERNAASVGGAAAAAKAQVLSGELAVKAQQLRQNAEMQQMQLRLAAQGMAIQQAQMAAQLQAQEQQRLLYSAALGGAGGDAQRAALQMPGMEKYLERSVQGPGGRTYFAPTSAQAGKINEAMRNLNLAKGVVQRMTSTLESGSPRTPEWLGGDRGKAESLESEMQTALNKIVELGALSGGDLAIINKRVPQLTAMFRTKSGAEAKLRALGESIDSAVLANIQDLLGGRPVVDRLKDE